MSEINVTPFVDVMLILLIIFMLTSHIINTGVDIDLPKTSENFSKKDDYLNTFFDAYWKGNLDLSSEKKFSELLGSHYEHGGWS